MHSEPGGSWPVRTTDQLWSLYLTLHILQSDYHRYRPWYWCSYCPRNRCSFISTTYCPRVNLHFHSVRLLFMFCAGRKKVRINLLLGRSALVLRCLSRGNKRSLHQMSQLTSIWSWLVGFNIMKEYFSFYHQTTILHMLFSRRNRGNSFKS